VAKRPLATVAILTYNGETYLERIIVAVLAQKVEGAVEVLVVDSGSTDSTLDIVARYPTVRLHQIPNSEFGHGKTRNLAATLATGEFIAFLTHDAVPTDDYWLAHLVKPFAVNERVVAVVGRQIPRPDCFPLQKFEIAGLFEDLGSVSGTTFYEADSAVPAKYEYLVSFFSDVSASVRRDFLVKTLPYRDVPYAEDQLFGKDVIEAGYVKAYAALATVEHSNDLTLHEYGKRIFDETVGLRRIGFDIPRVTLRRAFIGVSSGIVFDSYRILRDKDYSGGAKLRWLFVNPAYQLRKWQSMRRSSRVHLEDHDAIRAGSLEHSRKNAT
jgi:rhamnosyltransferase